MLFIVDVRWLWHQTPLKAQLWVFLGQKIVAQKAQIPYIALWWIGNSKQRYGKKEVGIGIGGSI